MTGGKTLLLGDVNIDTILPVSEFPVPGRDGLSKNIHVELGGAVINSAIVLDNLGQNSSILGCVGDDVWAEYIIKELSQTKIDQSFIRIKPKNTTGLTFIIVTPDGERTMFSYRGANVQLDANDIDEAVFKNADLLHISGYALMENPQKDTAWQAVQLAKKNHIPISLDTGLEPVIQKPDDLRRFLSETKICITGSQETSALFNVSKPEEAASYFLDLGIELAAIKMGEKGSLIISKDGKFFCPSFQINALDTTGAGDSFTAGILFGWLNGWSLQASAVLANALGALAASVYGAGFSLPARQQVIEFLSSEKASNFPSQSSIKEVIAFLKKDDRGPA